MSDFKTKFDQLTVEAADFASGPIKRFNDAMQEADKAVTELREAGLCVAIHSATNSSREGMGATRIIVSIARDLPKAKEAW
jgi:hypothetical protein